MTTPHTFIFDSYEADGKTLRFHYAYHNGPSFTETLELQTTVENVPQEVLEPLMLALHIALGMSYWKAYAPQLMELRSGQLTTEQAEFWNTVYTKGLGEFFFVNKIDFRNLVHFPAELEQTTEPTTMDTYGNIVPLGGGKDSLLTATILAGAKNEELQTLDTFSVNSYPIIEAQATRLGHNHLSIKRTIDPKLLELNAKDGIYNGHVPISVIYGLCSVLQAAVSNRRYVVLSNERSANEGNVDYLGEEINHQWSKSLEFERAFQDYIHNYITPSITYYSFLRPMSELLIVHLVSRFAEKHLETITSCNRNFRIAGPGERRWCGTCSKDASTFALFAAVGQKDAITELFEGQNLFDSEALLDTYRELLGVKDFKPFDCVGTVDEMQVAFYMAQKNGFEDTTAMNMYHEEVLPQIQLEPVERNSIGTEWTEDTPIAEKELMSLGAEHTMPTEAYELLANVYGIWDRQR